MSLIYERSTVPAKNCDAISFSRRRRRVVALQIEISNFPETARAAKRLSLEPVTDADGRKRHGGRRVDESLGGQSPRRLSRVRQVCARRPRRHARRTLPDDECDEYERDDENELRCECGNDDDDDDGNRTQRRSTGQRGSRERGRRSSRTRGVGNR